MNTSFILFDKLPFDAAFRELWLQNQEKLVTPNPLEFKTRNNQSQRLIWERKWSKVIEEGGITITRYGHTGVCLMFNGTVGLQ